MSAPSTTDFGDHAFEIPAWKTSLGHVAAVLVAIIFLGAGIGKIAIPYLVQQLFEQLLIPTWASMPLVITLGILETVGGILVLIPRYRRWGAMLITALLIAFIGYVGIRYGALVGRDCSCFPWLKRTVNAAFFAEDGAMLVGSLAAWWLSHKPGSLKIPVMTLASVAVVSAASFAYNNAHQSNVQLPLTITVDSKAYSLKEGRSFLFFYDPSCSHCDAAARHMSTYHWRSDVTVIGLPTNDPQWAASFLRDTKLLAKTSTDAAELRKLFTFSAPPYGVVVENGRVKGIIQHYDEPEPQTSLKQFGLVE